MWKLPLCKMENVWKRRRQVSKNAPSTPIIMSRSHLKYHLNKYKYARMYYTILYKKIKRITKNHPPHLPIKNYKFKSPLKAPIYIYQEKTYNICLPLSLSLWLSHSLSVSLNNKMTPQLYRTILTKYFYPPSERITV